MAEEKKETLIDKVEGVTKEEIQLFKHGTHCDTFEELFSSIEENYKRKSLLIDESEPRSQWKRAIRLYEKELYESIFGKIEKELIRAFAFGDYDSIKDRIKKLLLNGAKDWTEYSFRGCSLCYNGEIEERLLPPSQRGKRSGEALLKLQAEALKEAASIVAYKIAPVVDWPEISCWRLAIKVYGLEGHRQRASFGRSTFYDFGKKGYLTRKVNTLNNDVLNNGNQFSVMVCDGDTKRSASQEANSQLSDGAFENCQKGKIETVYFDKI